MAEEAEAVDEQLSSERWLYMAGTAERLERLLDTLEPLAEHVARIDALLTEFEPIIRKLMAPDASGPLAWAIRKRTGGIT